MEITELHKLYIFITNDVQITWQIKMKQKDVT